MDTPEFNQRFGILLEAYLRGCGEVMFVSVGKGGEREVVIVVLFFLSVVSGRFRSNTKRCVISCKWQLL